MRESQAIGQYSSPLWYLSLCMARQAAWMVGGDDYLGRSFLSLCRTIASINIPSSVRKERRKKGREGEVGGSNREPV
jgi:hypothetical protein